MREMTNPVKETIGARLRRLRRERGISQRALAAPGVSYAYISRIEAGERQPSTKALRQLAPKLGVSVEYLETISGIRSSGSYDSRTPSWRCVSAAGTTSRPSCAASSTRPRRAVTGRPLRARVSRWALPPASAATRPRPSS